LVDLAALEPVAGGPANNFGQHVRARPLARKKVETDAVQIEGGLGSADGDQRGLGTA